MAIGAIGAIGAPPDAATAATIHSDVRTPAGDEAAATRADVLTALATAADPATFVRAHAATLTALRADPSSAHAVTGWWATLGDAERGRLLADAASTLGNLGGIPYAVRAAANDAALAARIERDERLVEAGGNRDAATELAMLRKVSEALDAPLGEPARSLVSFDPRDGGRAAIAVGDLSTADYVSVLVPGMFFSVDAQIVDWTATADELIAEQGRRLTDLGQGGTVAAIAWIGYRTPGLGDVLNLTLADQGASAIERDLVALRTVRAGDEPCVTMIAHSYGSTAALLALQRGTVQVDALALVGTPGSDARDAAALDVVPGQVYVGEAAWDPIAGSRFFGNDPGLAGYGATRIATGAGVDPLDGRAMTGSTGHNGYFDAGSQTMRNLALIGIGRGDLVTTAP